MNSAQQPIPDNLSATQARRPDGHWEGIACISGMDCGACAVELEQAARQVGGFQQFAVNPASHLAQWVAESPQAIEALARKAKRLGYALGLQEGSSSELQQMKNKKAARSRFLRFLVAALCMMQIMMYSTPEYLFAAEDIGLAETGLLRWAQWVLAWPLMLYCAQPYFRRAWVATFQGRLVMDQPIVLGLLLAFVLSSLNLSNPAGHVWFDSIAMLLTLLLLVQMGIENQAAKALLHLANLQPDLPLQVEVPEGDGWTSLPVAQLRVGQVYRLVKSQAVPVDSEVVREESTVWVDEAMRTGEVDPVLKKQGDLIQAGSKILTDHAVLRYLQQAKDDSLLSLGQLLLQSLAAKPIHQDKVDKLLPWFVLGVLLCAALTAIYWALLKMQPDRAASATVAVLIVTCPCALALALPLVRLFGVRSLAEAGVLVRNPQALDTLNRIQVLALDKTGTLTKPGIHPVFQQNISGLPEICEPEILNALCMLARKSAHPVSRAVAGHLFNRLQAQARPVDWLNFQEVPGAGLVGIFMNGMQRVELRLGNAAHCGISSVQGFSSHAFASCTVDQKPASPQALLFSVVFQADHALRIQFDSLRKLGLELHMLSGDNLGAVQQWAPALQFNSRQGGMQPEEKTRWIASRQHEKKAVAMVGDGLNDSGAFAQADVSFAAAGASTLSAGQADFLLMKPGLAGLLAAFNTAQLVEKIGRQNLWWALAYNCIAVPFAAAGLLTPWMASVGMGLSSLVVFANALRVKARHNLQAD
ncbi:MAG TPA: HAD-IC family P-type ATPase [Limnobacter sp.]|nr:HAD-IC family P-type ATPase [Limnobacter sp.]